MPIRSQAIRNIFSGISRLPQTQRAESEWQDLANTQVFDGQLLGRRPPTYHVAKLAGITSARPTTIPIVRGANEKYTAVISNGLLKVFDGYDGTEVPLEAPSGFSYLAQAPEGFRWVTVGDRTILVNRSTLVRKGIATAPAGGNTTLVVVRQGNFGTSYSVTVGATTVTHLTVESTIANAEEAISTDAIASALHVLLFAALSASYTFTLLGSTIAITPLDADAEYEVSTTDGLGNDGLSVIKGSTQRFSDLPTQAPDGILVEIRGDETTAFDNFWVRYSADKSVWEETVAPNALLGFNTATMPHLLEYRGPFVDPTAHDDYTASSRFRNAGLALEPNALVGKLCENLSDGSQATVLSNTATEIFTTPLAGGGTNLFKANDLVQIRGYGRYFIFRRGPWAEREAGDTITNPYPSFVNRRIRDIAVIQGRLLLLGRESLVQSRARDLFDFFRHTVTLVEPDGPIDITDALPSSSAFHAVTDWDGETYVWTDLGQYELRGEPIMSPQTVSLRQVARFPNSPLVRPIVAGSRMFFVGIVNGQPKVMEMSRYGQERKLSAQSLSERTPGLIEGTPIHMASDDTLGFLAVTTQTTAGNNLYILTYQLQDGERVQQAWHRWIVASLDT